MSDLNDVELLISFDELKQLEIDVVPAWADKYNALSICKGSLAEPSEIYKLWVQKLFKAYDLKEFTNNDWRIIIEYLKDILDGFVKNLDPLKDTARQQLNQWWQDTKDLLTWLWSIIDSVDAEIVYLLMILALEIVIKTCKFASGRNVMPILGHTTN
ncbi:hypothetical protein DOY81_014206 [Sarcophaga bullata]|nr:hypothetical protein DOY81_014206 [Sarcophaga bullata]